MRRQRRLWIQRIRTVTALLPALYAAPRSASPIRSRWPSSLILRANFCSRVGAPLVRGLPSSIRFLSSREWWTGMPHKEPPTSGLGTDVGSRAPFALVDLT